MSRPVITDCEGLSLSTEEKALFRDTKPYGFIVFARNCQSPDQLRALTDEMRDVVEKDDIPILIDQEGGRVRRLNPEHWRKPPAPARFAELYDTNPDLAREAMIINTRLMADELLTMGINVNCFPLLDLTFPQTHDVIGDRSFGSDPKKVIALANAACEGLLGGGVLPMIKHIPGHGRATADSHRELPVVDTLYEELRETDFVPFRALSHMPCAMTAHVKYTDLDEQHCATVSSKIIRQIIREDIGFEGVLFSDDVSMKALSDDVAENAKAALQAGCDLVIHCNGSLEERRSVLEKLYDFNVVNDSWVNTVLSARRKNPQNIDHQALSEWLDKTVGQG